MTASRILEALTIGLLAAGLHAATQAGVSDGYVKGAVSAASLTYHPVSNEYGDAVYPGHRLTITVSGTVDINWRRRWEEECFFRCWRREWIEHNWKTPQQWPVVFQLVDAGGQVKHELVTEDGKLDFTVPVAGAADFNNKLKLQAKLAPGTPAVNPDQTQNEFDVEVRVSTNERLQKLPLFLYESIPSPDAATLKKAWQTDPFFREQNPAALAKALVDYARSVFPASKPANASAHRELLEYAGDIDRQGVQSGTALAEMYLAQGDAMNEQAERVKVIKTLQEKIAKGAGEETQIQLGEAYLKLATAIGKATGFPDAQARMNMSANYAAAIAIAQDSHAPMLAVQAYAGRAVMNRELNTPEALKAAEQDFRSARDLLPMRVAGSPIHVTMGGKELLVQDLPGQRDVAWTSLQEPAAEPLRLPVAGVALRPYAVANDGRVLAATSKNVGWLDIRASPRTFNRIAQLPSEMLRGATNGTVALVVLAPAAGDQQVSTMLVAPGIEPRPVLLEGKPVEMATMASSAPRYVVHRWVQPKPGATPPLPTLIFELREVGSSSDITIRRIAYTSWARVLGYRISPDGKKVAALVDDAMMAKRRLLVWDDATSQTEVLAQPGFPSPTALPASTVVDFDFAPAGDQLLTVSREGKLATLTISEHASLQALGGDAEQAAGPFIRVGLIASVGGAQTILDGDYEMGRIVSVVDWPSRQVTLLNAKKIPDAFLGPVGFVRLPDGRLGSVQTAWQPFTVRTLRASDATVIAEDTLVQKEFIRLQALSGGRYLCISGSKIVLRDLVEHSDTEVKILPPAALPDSERLACLPHVAEGRWTLLTHRGGVVTSAQTYRGAQALSAANMMPPVPVELIQQEEAAAKRIGVKPQPPAFFVQDGVDGPFELLDGMQFAIATSRATFQEAISNPGKTSWTSVPYVMLQQEALKVQFARLPADGWILKILPPPANKLIYSRGQKIFWKPLGTESEGKVLLEFPTPMIPLNSMHWIVIRAALDGGRLLIAELSFNRETGASVAGKRLFRVADDGIFPIPCNGCDKRAFNAKDLLADSLKPGPVPFMNAPADAELDNHVVYGPDHTSVYNVSRNTFSAALPPRPIFWVGDGQAYYVSGKNELSLVRY